jgi:hypothetical protein
VRLSQYHELPARFLPKRPAYRGRRSLAGSFLFRERSLMEGYEVKWENFKMKRAVSHAD